MSKLDIVRRCPICGAVLQGEDKAENGYIDPEILKNAKLSEVLTCEKCYNENRYNLTPMEAQVTDDFLTMLKDALASDSLIVYLVDLFSFECSFNSKVTNLIKNLPILMTGNKVDLMPKGTDLEALREYIAHRSRVAGLPLTKDDVVLTSLSSTNDLKDIADLIKEKRRRHDVYIIGESRSGKSMFFNSFLRVYHNTTQKTITMRNYPGTDLSLMEIPLDNSSSLFDTPGTGLDNSLLGLVSTSDARKIEPMTAIKPKKVTMDPNTSLIFGSVARLDLKKNNEKCPITIYMAPDIKIKKVGAKDDKDGKLVEAVEDGVFPSLAGLETLKDFDAFDITVEDKGQRDIGIAGLGWFSFVGNNQTFRIFVPKGVGIYSSRTKIKYVDK